MKGHPEMFQLSYLNLLHLWFLNIWTGLFWSLQRNKQKTTNKSSVKLEIPFLVPEKHYSFLPSLPLNISYGAETLWMALLMYAVCTEKSWAHKRHWPNVLWIKWLHVNNSSQISGWMSPIWRSLFWLLYLLTDSVMTLWFHELTLIFFLSHK